MKERIEKERIHLFAPGDVLVTHVEIEGIIFEEKLRESVKNAVSKNELLNARVVIDKNGSAYYETQKFDENPNDMVRILHHVYWKDIVNEQESIAFDLDHGELMRFYYLINEEKQEFLLIAHALAGDAISHALLLNDIIKGLADMPVKAKPVMLCRMDQLPGESQLSFLEKMKLKGILHNWKKEGTGFSEEEYYQLHAKVWKNKKTYIQYETFYKDALYRLAMYAKEHQVTVNSVILTAFAKASRELRHAVVADESGRQQTAELKPDEIAMVLSMRDDYDGMGDYEYTYPLHYLYDETLDFAENVQKLHNSIHLDQPKERYQQLVWLRELPGELVDSMQFQAVGEYMNPVTEEVMKQFSISTAPKGMAVTNLVKVPLSAKYGSYKLRNYVYVPPVLANARRIIGITTFQGTMNISFHAMQDEFTPNSRLFYQKAIACLRAL